MSSSERFAAVALVAAAALGGCQDSSPAPHGDGDHRLYATSSGGGVPDASLAIEGPDVTLAQGTSIAEYTIGSPAEAVTLCPPNGTGSPIRLDGGPMTIGDLEIQSPALFGDCGHTRPVRVTVVDLESFDEFEFPFARWAEFCDITDPDC